MERESKPLSLTDFFFSSNSTVAGASPNSCGHKAFGKEEVHR